MKRRILVLLAVLVVAGVATVPVAAKGRPGAGTIYVESQDLYYDTFVTVESLPAKGPFQELVGHTTEFGPGDPGYVGGRWWVDENENGVMDEGDTYFLCPLLGPGREEP